MEDNDANRSVNSLQKQLQEAAASSKFKEHAIQCQSDASKFKGVFFTSN